MAEKTKISWTDSTFNPWIGCTKIGPGCDHCYAEALDSRMRWEGKKHWGAGVPRRRTAISNWHKPIVWNAKQTSMLAGDTKTPPWRVFCASLADVFDNEVPDEWRRDLWDLVSKTENLSWLLVTKRIGNVVNMVPHNWKAAGWPPNVRIIATIVNQEEADRDIPKLLALPCKNGISYEPALGPVDWWEWFRVEVGERGIEWVIVGGESAQGGAKARPFDIRWARDTIAQCNAAGVPVFVKQLGSAPHDTTERSGLAPGVASSQWNVRWQLKDRAGGDPSEWPEDLRVRDFPA